jgi:hypothetical protein
MRSDSKRNLLALRQPVKRMIFHFCFQDTYRQGDRWRSTIDVIFEQAKNLGAAFLFKLNAVAHNNPVLQDERIWPGFRLCPWCRMGFGIRRQERRPDEPDQEETK